MIKATVYRIGTTLVPSDSSSMARITQLKEGEPYMVQVWKPRNIKLHNYYFALLRLFVHNTDLLEFMPKDDSPSSEEYAVTMFRKAIMFHLNMVEKVHDLDGKTVHIIPKSISFESMDDEEFETHVVKPTIDIICKLLNCTQEQLEEMLGDYI